MCKLVLLNHPTCLRKESIIHMNKQEYLLNKLSQECIEVAKEISKALEFGLDDIYLRDKPYKSNKQKIETELNDLLGTLIKVIDNGILDSTPIYDNDGHIKKIEKINKYMEYAREIGVLK